jgi:phospholipase/carboxylesterase
MLTMAASPMSCRADAPPTTADWGGLQIAKVGQMREDERGGTAVVLLHGWGASGDDLVSLAHDLARPRTRFFVPAAPLVEGAGRAWWHLDADRPSHAFDGEMPEGYQPRRQVSAVRRAVQTLLRTIRSRYAPDVLVLGGFSQGAMLSLDVALAADPAVDRVAVLSGSLLADSLEGLHATRTSRPPIFMSHGRRDAMLSFQGSERAKLTLEQHGFAVTWHPFEGAHEIPRAVVEHLKDFLFNGTRP